MELRFEIAGQYYNNKYKTLTKNNEYKTWKMSNWIFFIIVINVP